jgi:uncharacterized delta-60 repeat protein
MRSLSCSFVIVAVLGCGKVSGPTPPPPDGSTGSGLLALAKPNRWVPQNGSTTVGFTIMRGDDTAGALTVHVDGLPAGVTAPDVAVAAGDANGTLTFAAATAAALGSSTQVDVQLVRDGDALDHQPFTVEVSGARGTLDTTFGTAGRVVFPLPDPVVPATSGNAYVRAFAQDKSGKIVAAVQLETTGATTTTHKVALVRFNADGTADAGFGTGGYVLFDAGPADFELPRGVVLDSQNRVVVLAQREQNVCVQVIARFTASGAPDPTFTTYNAGPPGGYCGTPIDLVVLPGDKIATLSVWNNPDTSQRVMLTQLNSDGTPDNNAFPGSGYTIRMPNPDTTKPTFAGFKLLVDDQGRFVTAGYRCEGGWNAALSACTSAVGRITPAGAWDTTFGTGGAGHLGYSELVFGATTTPSLVQAFESFAIDHAGNIVVAGNNDGYTTATLARFTTTGAIDTSFGTSGRLTPSLVAGGTSQQLDEITFDDDGEIVAAGYVNSGGGLVATTRYSADGVIDASFGAGGVGTAPAAGLQPRMLVQPDGRIVVLGANPRGTGGADLALWRFWP